MPKVSARVVLVTCSRLPEARKIAHAVVEQKLAACVNIATAPIQSVYRWKGKVESASEYLLVMKTTRQRLKELEKAVLSLHSYDTPEFLVLPAEGGSTAYLQWVAEGTQEGRPRKAATRKAAPDPGRR